MAEGVGQQFRNQQADAAGRGGVDHDFLGDHVDADALTAVEVPDRGGDAADVGAERHLVAKRGGNPGLAQLLVEQLQRLHPAGEHDEVLAGAGVARLHSNQTDDHRQMVLDPVLHLGELQLNRFEPALGDGEVARAQSAEKVDDFSVFIDAPA